MSAVGERQVADGNGKNPSGPQGWRCSGTMAGMLYRLIYNANKIKMKGESM